MDCINVYARRKVRSPSVPYSWRIMKKARYQSGCITLRKRAKGAAVWQFRWWDTDAAGHRVQRSELLGTLEELPTKRDAQEAADALRLEVNAELPQAVPVTV